MPTLYSESDSNIRKTWIYLTGFFLFVIAVGWLLSYVLNSYLILVLAVVLAIGMNITAYWYSDKLVLSMTRAKEIKKEDNPELYRLVENLAITAGLPTPRVFIVDDPQPNAFATGRDPNHAVIAVTSGILERLERVELEGVIAHEMSHIGNRDMLISTAVVVLAGVVALMADFFFRITFFGGFGRGNRDNNGQLGVILLVVTIAVLILAPIAAQMIRFAVSRKRELLADSSGALLTRYPEGLARALEKISADPHELKTANNATAHLFFVNPFRGKRAATWMHKMFMTHPPIEERIALLRSME